MKGYEHLKVSDIERKNLAKAQKPSKYKNVKVTVDGHVFDSKRESARYHELKLMERAGLITELELQPKFPLFAWVLGGGTPAVVGVYRADFAYLQDGQRVVEDVKGMTALPLFRWKVKHLRLQEGITVQEIR